jgi:hypothetical protein
MISAGEVAITTAGSKRGAPATSVPLPAFLDSFAGNPIVSQHFHCALVLLDSTTALETHSKERVRHIRDCCYARGAPCPLADHLRLPCYVNETDSHTAEDRISFQLS